MLISSALVFQTVPQSFSSLLYISHNTVQNLPYLSPESDCSPEVLLLFLLFDSWGFQFIFQWYRESLSLKTFISFAIEFRLLFSFCLLNLCFSSAFGWFQERFRSVFFIFDWKHWWERICRLLQFDNYRIFWVLTGMTMSFYPIFSYFFSPA